MVTSELTDGSLYPYMSHILGWVSCFLILIPTIYATIKWRDLCGADLLMLIFIPFLVPILGSMYLYSKVKKKIGILKL